MLSLLRSLRTLRRVLLPTAVALCLSVHATSPSAQSDLDTFMRDVLSTRDTNWKKLQQYILDERELLELRGPSGALMWGERRDYTWYIRDGFFVRSPVKVNGSAVGEPERLKYEADFLRRAQRRDARQQSDVQDTSSPSASSGAAPSNEPPRDLDGLIRQTRQPQFISSAYFLRFQFDEGRYALVGREQLEGQEVLRIEYYPQNLFSERRRRERQDGNGRNDSQSADSRAFSAELMRLMNSTSRVTLWIAPATQQILKYTFDDLDWNFFPGQWLAQMDGVSASMTMGQPFADVWLPRGLEMRIGVALAFGHVDVRYTLDYENYRQADVETKVGMPDRP
jgi:hypothetical protein